MAPKAGAPNAGAAPKLLVDVGVEAAPKGLVVGAPNGEDLALPNRFSTKIGNILLNYLPVWSLRYQYVETSTLARSFFQRKL